MTPGEGLSPHLRRLLDEVISQYLRAEESGSPPDRAKLIARHPELAAHLHSFFTAYDEEHTERTDASERGPSKPGTIGPGAPTLPVNGAAEDEPPAALGPEDLETLPAGTPDTSRFDHEREPPRSPSPSGPARRFGDYELIEEISRGGMGVVFKARQVSLDRVVALKMILAGQLAGQEEVRRFHAEAEAAANLDHPGIVPIYEVGQIEGQHYFSMGFVEGQSLAKKMSGGPLPPREAAELVRSVAEAMAYAHRQGVIHRDLKPGNVLLDAAGNPRVTDFGLAKRTQRDSQLTGAGQILGTPSYMPPEQAAGRLDVTTLADVYALGAVLYAALVGRPPFQAASVMETLRQVLQRDPLPPRQLNAQVPRDLETICLKCLRKEPEKRYESAQAVADDLGRFLRDEPIVARPVGRVERAVKWVRRHPVTALLIAAVAASLMAGTTVSTIFAVLAERRAASEAAAKAEALKAKADAVDKLWGSYLAEAQARRWSGQAGRRFKSLEVLAQAAEIRPSLELRNEAIACMALADLKVGRQWPGRPPGTRFVTVDPAYQRYARSDVNGNIIVRRLSDEEEVARLPGFNASSEWAFQLSPGGRYLAATYMQGRQYISRLWDVDQQETVLKFPSHIFQFAVHFSPDGRRIAWGVADGSIHIRDLASGEEVARLRSLGNLYALRFSPDGARLAASCHRPGKVQVFDCSTKQVVATLVHPSRARGVAWHPGGGLLACASGFNVYVWDLAQPTRPLAVAKGHISEATFVAFSHGGDLLASTGWDGNVRLWNSRSGVQLVSMRVNTTRLEFDPADRWLGLATDESMLGLLRVAGRREYRTLAGHEGDKGPWRVTFSPDGRLIATSSSDGVRLWDARSGREVAHLAVKGSWSALFHPSGTGLITCGASGAHHWPIAAGAGSLDVGPPEDLRMGRALGVACLSADARYLGLIAGYFSGFTGQRGELWDLKQKTVRVLPHSALGSSIAISADNQWAATGVYGESNVKVWNLHTGTLVRVLPGKGRVHVCFSPDGKWLVTGSGAKYQFYETGAWIPRHHVEQPRHGELASPIAFTRDGKLAAVLRSNRVVRLIEPDSGRELATLEVPDQYLVTWLAFSPDGGQLAAATENHRLQLWDLRVIRRRLQAMRLDWDLPPLPPPSDRGATPLKVNVDTGVLALHAVFERAGDHVRQARFREAEQEYQAGLTAMEALLARTPADVHARDTAATMYYQCGLMFDRQNRREQARAMFRKAVAHGEQVLERLPHDPHYQNHLGWYLCTLSRLLRRDRQLDLALAPGRRAFELQRSARKAEPDNGVFHASLRIACQNYAHCCLAAGDHARAVEAAEELISRNPFGGDFYMAGSVLARSIPLVERDEALNEGRRDELAEAYAARAVALLRAAKQHGGLPGAVKTSSIFRPLRARADFKQLVEE